MVARVLYKIYFGYFQYVRVDEFYILFPSIYLSKLLCKLLFVDGSFVNVSGC